MFGDSKAKVIRKCEHSRGETEVRAERGHHQMKESLESSTCAEFDRSSLMHLLCVKDLVRCNCGCLRAGRLTLGVGAEIGGRGER